MMHNMAGEIYLLTPLLAFGHFPATFECAMRLAAARRGPVSIGDCGIVCECQPDGDYVINFPAKDGWVATANCIRLSKMAEQIRPGARVRVAPGFAPQGGWGSVTSSSVGFVRKVLPDGHVECEFGVGTPHTFMLVELQPVRSSDGDWAGAIQCGNAVRVRRALSSPSTGWGSVKAESVGYVKTRSKDGVYIVVSRVCCACVTPTRRQRQCHSIFDGLFSDFVFRTSLKVMTGKGEKRILRSRRSSIAFGPAPA